MSTEFVTVLLFGGLLLLLAAGVPVVFSLGAICVLITFVIGGTPDLFMVATTTYRQLTDPGLMTIPLFLLMGNFLIHSGISDRLFTGLNHWLSGVRGGLAIVSIGVCVALAMCGGFGPGILTMGLIAVPAMLKNHYNKQLALGAVMAGGVLAEVIPPSIIMIIYGYIARLSIGKLFMAGVIPGFICAASYIAYVLIRCYTRPELAPKSAAEVTWNKRWASLKDIVSPSLLVVLVLGSIFSGMATPTEAAGIGASGAFVICLMHQGMNWQVLTDSCLETMKISGMALWILVTATLFGVVYTNAGAQDMVLSIVEGLPVTPWIVLIAMQFILILFGMFMDDYAVLTICAPIFIPIVQFLGFDPLWFALVFILNMQVAYLSPPFGWALILMKGVAPPEVTTRDIWMAVPPFAAIQLLVLVATMIFPQLTLWLPSKIL